MAKKKIKITTNHLLLLCVAALTVVCYISISRPIRFDNERQRRERLVRQRLLSIRVAEEKYRATTGIFTDDLGELSRHRLLADSLQTIPFSHGKRFAMQVDEQGRQQPLMECSATYDDYLQGLDPNQRALLKQDAEEKGKFPGMKVGDIATNNNNALSWE